MAGIKEVCYWNASEAGATKEPKTYENFQYESAAVQDFNDISQKVAKIKSDVQAITSKYTALKGKFDEFTGFNDEMDKNSNSLNNFANQIETYAKQCITAAQGFINEHVKTDQSFQSDLDNLNSIISNGKLSEGTEAGAVFKH